MQLLRLSRTSFWFASAVAALALFAPGGHERLLTALAVAASLAALGLWRAGLHRAARAPGDALPAAADAAFGESALVDAAAQLLRGVREAASFEAALHRVAAVLRSELGARRVTVCHIEGVDATHARLRDLVEAQPGFRAGERRWRLDDTPLAIALRGAGQAGQAPGTAAIAVGAETGRAVAAIEWAGIELAVEPDALADLLALARAALEERARPGAVAVVPVPRPNVLLIEDDAARPGATARLLRRLGCRVTPARDVQDGLASRPGRQFDLILLDLPAPAIEAAGAWQRAGGPTPVIALVAADEAGDAGRFRELGFDDHLLKPLRPSRVLAMLMRHLRPQADAGRASGTTGDGAGGVLDAAALARLGELDPTGANGLIAKVLRTFQSSVARLHPQLLAARAANDRPTIKLVAHTLKSSSASIGALRLSQQCAQVEAAVRLETGDLPALLDGFDAALAVTLQAIDHELKGRP